MMESDDNTSKMRSMSATHSLNSQSMADENLLSYRDSLICGSKPKIQLLELNENIQNAENNYEAMKMQWELVKSLHRNEGYDGALSQRSVSSYSSFKLSETSAIKEEPDIIEDYRKVNAALLDNVQGDNNQVQVVLTPRSAKNDSHASIREEQIVPKLEIRNAGSLDSIKTNKRGKRFVRKKKRIVDEEIYKPSALLNLKANRRKIKGRLKGSNSKSTIATRDSNFSDKKGEKKKFKRQKSSDAISLQHTPRARKRGHTLKGRESKQLASKDFIEIYHNAALKSGGSLSIVSSHQSKVEPGEVAQIQEEDVQADDVHSREIVLAESTTDTIAEHPRNRSKQKEHCQSPCKQEQNETCCHHQHHHENQNMNSQEMYDSFYQRNYEMPTMASKMKRVHRPYFHQFHIRNIPFVVGTSLSPSHNIGLSIQQVLSTIKTKQPSVPSISPLLIRKVSRGIRPVSTIIEHISNQYAKCIEMPHDISPEPGNKVALNNQDRFSFVSEYLRSDVSQMTSQAQVNLNKSNLTCEPLYEEDEESRSTMSETRRRDLKESNVYDVEVSKDTVANVHALARQKQKHSRKMAETGDSANANYFSYTRNKNITEVFQKLHDDFDRMIKQHEKLKEQLEKRKDKSLIKEVSEMETEISAKEQEINVLANLYKEVMSLKQQMKLLHERNSFVCIATENTMYPQSARLQRRAHTAGYFEVNAKPKSHETPNALRLAGLLRQIQAFQRQLSLA